MSTKVHPLLFFTQNQINSYEVHKWVIGSTKSENQKSGVEFTKSGGPMSEITEMVLPQITITKKSTNQ